MDFYICTLNWIIIHLDLSSFYVWKKKKKKKKKKNLGIFIFFLN